MVRQWHKEIVESLPLQVFKICVDVALRDVVRHMSGGLMHRLDDLSGLLQT